MQVMVSANLSQAARDPGAISFNANCICGVLAPRNFYIFKRGVKGGSYARIMDIKRLSA